MKWNLLTFMMVVLFFACKNDSESRANDTIVEATGEMVFDKEKWQVLDGKDYPYRAKMLNNVLYNDTIRTLNKEEILELLGAPSYYRDNDNFLYYTITQNRLGLLKLKSKTMVIKIGEDQIVEWIKVHE